MHCPGGAGGLAAVSAAVVAAGVAVAEWAIAYAAVLAAGAVAVAAVTFALYRVALARTVLVAPGRRRSRVPLSLPAARTAQAITGPRQVIPGVVVSSETGERMTR